MPLLRFTKPAGSAICMMQGVRQQQRAVEAMARGGYNCAPRAMCAGEATYIDVDHEREAQRAVADLRELPSVVNAHLQPRDRHGGAVRPGNRCRRREVSSAAAAPLLTALAPWRLA